MIAALGGLLLTACFVEVDYGAGRPCSACGVDELPVEQEGGRGPDAGPSSLLELDITGPAVTDDTSILLEAPRANRGQDEEFSAGANLFAIGLLRFDLRAIDPGTEVTSAELTLHVSSDIAAVGLVAHALSESWVEGEATFLQRDRDSEWSQIGGAAELATAASASTPPVAGPVRVELPIELVQAWIDRPAGNHGLRWHALTEEGIDARFWSSESEREDRRPVLSLTLAVDL